MPIRDGDLVPSAFRLGTATVQRLYFGDALVWPPPAVTPTLVGSLSTRAASNTSVSLASTNFPANTQTGDLVLAIVTWRRGTQAVISSANAGATLVDSQVSGSSVRVSVFWKLKTASENSWAFTMPTAATSSVVIDTFTFRGFNATTPVGTPSIFNNTATATTVPTPSIAVTPRAMIVASATYTPTASSRTVAWGTPYLEVSDQVVGTTGAYVGTSTAWEADEGAGTAPQGTAVISATQTNRVGYLIPINPA